jgi:hypothetical protein
MSKLILKYTVYRIVHLLVLIELAIPFAMYGRNNTKETGCLLFMGMKELKLVSAGGLYSPEIGFQFVDVDADISAIHITTLLMLF